MTGSVGLPAYKRTLEEIGRLTQDWDGYGAPAIDKTAIEHCEDVLSRLPVGIADMTRILPTEYGGVQVKLRTKGAVVVSCDFGDQTMSYYIDIPGRKTEYNDFLNYTSDNINALVLKIQRFS